MLKRSVNDAHEERPGVHIQAVYGLTVRAVWQFTHNVRRNVIQFHKMTVFAIVT